MSDAPTDNWISRLQTGDTDTFGEFFQLHRPRLRRMIEWRMDGRLNDRIDVSDVLQETYVDARRRLTQYLRKPRVPTYVWLRGLAYERLLRLQRRHLGAKCRAVQRQVGLPAESSAILAQRLSGSLSTPSRAVMRKELQMRVQAAVASLKEMDREIILMRHFEDMSNSEVAQELGLSDSAASMRYGRAIFRLKERLFPLSERGAS